MNATRTLLLIGLLISALMPLDPTKAQGPPTANVNVVNVADVNVVGTPGVTVENDDFNPIPVEVMPAFPRMPFTFRDVASQNSGTDITISFTVPSDKRLVIELATARVEPGPGGEIRFSSIQLTTNGTRAAHFFSIPLSCTNCFSGGNTYQTAQPLRLYADPDTSVAIAVARTVGSGFYRVQGSVSGYLVPLDSPSLEP